MKQTAVEFYSQEEIKLTLDFLENKITQLEYGIKKLRLVEQAKEMEKEQIKNSYIQGFKYRDTWGWELETDWEIHSNKENEQSFEQYYNKTFKSE